MLPRIHVASCHEGKRPLVSSDAEWHAGEQTHANSERPAGRHGGRVVGGGKATACRLPYHTVQRLCRLAAIHGSRGQSPWKSGNAVGNGRPYPALRLRNPRLDLRDAKRLGTIRQFVRRFPRRRRPAAVRVRRWRAASGLVRGSGPRGLHGRRRLIGEPIATGG
jgi:hypothetical protein